MTPRDAALLQPRFIFLQFMNPEVSSLYGVAERWRAGQLHNEWIRLAKYGLLIADEGLVVPASYLFEVKGIERFLRDIDEVRAAGLLKFASPTADLVAYAEEKQREYRDELPLFPKYSESRQAADDRGKLAWIPRVARSASADITKLWREELELPSGLWRELLEDKSTRQLRLPSMLESAINAVPDKLEGRAFIYRFAKPLLPFKPDMASETQLKLLISRAYLHSYLEELDAAILVETPLGDLDCGIDPYTESGRIRAVSWRSLAECLEALDVRKEFEGLLSWRDLLRFRSHPVLRWVIALLVSGKEGSETFAGLMRTSRYRPTPDRSRSSKRAFDVVSDRLWRFHAAVAPITSWGDPPAHSTVMAMFPELARRRTRTARRAAQLSLIANQIDVGIVVALQEEFRELFDQIPQAAADYDKEANAYFYQFVRAGLPGQRPYSCVATFAGGVGPTKAALRTSKLMSRWKVKTLVNLGIAAGLDDDVRLGDVVAVALADNYMERSKAIDAAGGCGFDFTLAGESFRPSADLLEHASNFEFAHPELFREWLATCAAMLKQLVHPTVADDLTRRGFLRAEPIIVQGHVASGPSVGASLAFKRWLKGRDRSYLALEMEVGGVLWAIYDEARPHKTIALKGISDFGDERKKDLDLIDRDADRPSAGALRAYAMRCALAALWSLLQAGALPQHESPGLA